jgi:hypothetical protein
MFAWSQVALGLLLLHVFWLVFFLVGSLTLGRTTPSQTDRGPSGALTELVTASAAGIAITGLFGFIAVATGIFTPWSLLALVVALAILAHLRGVRVLGGDFWRDRAAVIAGAFRWPSAFVYVLGLAIAVPAVLPDISFDPNMVHLPYAYEWAQAHRLTVDPNFRFPYYTMNWQLLYGWLFLFNLGDWTAMLSALCGILCGLGIQAALSSYVWRREPGERTPAVEAIVLVAAPLMFLLSPTTLRWGITSMLDLPIAFVFLATVLLAAKGLENGANRETMVRLVVCGGFFIGLKPSFFMFVPLIAVLVWLAGKNALGSKRGAALTVLLFVATASPWYVRSFIGDGDPIAPYLNLAIVHKDAKFSQFDWDQIGKDLISDRDALSLLKLPYRIFVHPDNFNFREYGVTFSLVGVYLPFIFLWLVLTLQNKFFSRDRRLMIFATCTAYATAYWLATSYLSRYALLFAPELAVCLGAWLFYLSQRGGRAAIAAAALALICVLPSPSSSEWLTHQVLAYYVYLPGVYTGREDYLERNLAAYRSEEYISRFESAPGRSKRVLALCCKELTYRFRLHGVTLLGDFVGPERYWDFDIALHTNALAGYFDRFGVDAIIAQRKSFFSSHEIDDLIAGAGRLGFRTGPSFDDQTVILLRDGASTK